jgi:hypothetical protein
MEAKTAASNVERNERMSWQLLQQMNQREQIQHVKRQYHYDQVIGSVQTAAMSNSQGTRRAANVEGLNQIGLVPTWAWHLLLTGRLEVHLGT